MWTKDKCTTQPTQSLLDIELNDAKQMRIRSLFLALDYGESDGINQIKFTHC